MTKSPHQETAINQARDPHGHFATKQEATQAPIPEQENPSFFKKLFAQTALSKTDDDNTLLDVHIGNPLHKITTILEDIKKQKAFSFNIKGSLGLTGVFILIAGLGLLGGFRAFCNKGVQSHIGSLRILQAEKNLQTTNIPVLTTLIQSIKSFQSPKDQVKSIARHLILIKPDYSTIQLEISPNLKDIPVLSFLNQQTIVTGSFDSCSNTIKITFPDSIEPY